MTLPMLLIGSGQSFTHSKLINSGSFRFSQPPLRDSQARLDSQQTPPFSLAARDEQKQKEKCDWIGICEQ